MNDPLPPKDFAAWAEHIAESLERNAHLPTTAIAGMRHLARSIRLAQNDDDPPEEAVEQRSLIP